MPLADFETLSSENTQSIQDDFELDKEVKKAAKRNKVKAATQKKDTPSNKPPSVALLREINNIGKDNYDKKQFNNKLKELEILDRLKLHFNAVFQHRGLKYPKVTIQNSIEEIIAQKEQVLNDLSTSNSIPNTYRFFKVFTEGLQKVLQDVCGLQVVNSAGNSFAEICNNEPGFSAFFARPLAIIAIKHGLFKSGPWMDMLMGFSSVLMIVNSTPAEVKLNVNDEEKLAEKFGKL